MESVHFKISNYKCTNKHNTHPDPLGTTLTPKLKYNNKMTLLKNLIYQMHYFHKRVNTTIVGKQKQNATKKR